MEQDLTTLIVELLREFYGQGGALGEITRETPLFGPDGILDSLALVSFIVAVEQAIEDECGMTLSLADDRAMSQRRSPYRTIGSLADYALSLLPKPEDAANG